MNGHKVPLIFKSTDLRHVSPCVNISLFDEHNAEDMQLKARPVGCITGNYEN